MSSNSWFDGLPWWGKLLAMATGGVLLYKLNEYQNNELYRLHGQETNNIVDDLLRMRPTDAHATLDGLLVNMNSDRIKVLRWVLSDKSNQGNTLARSLLGRIPSDK
jgi:hypothetical protein